MNKVITPAIIFTISIVVILSGCGSPLVPFDSAAIEQNKDKTVPVITISSPETDTEYGQFVTVSGEVTDNGELLPELDWTVSDSLGSRVQTGTIELAAVDSEEGVKGGFSFQFATSDYSSDIVIEISGSDWNGNEAVPVKIRLVYPGNTIPSFRVVADSGSVACSWSEIDGASSYRIYFTTDGSIPSENYGESTAVLTEAFSEGSPYVIDGLQNGAPHVLKLIAYSDNEDSWTSELKTVVPLSKLTLFPRTDAGSGYISLEWNDVSDYYGYEVYRAESPGAVPVSISGVINSNSFTDVRVNEGVDYYYYIKPAVEGASMSAPAVCSGFPLSSSKDRTVSSVINQSNIRKSRVYESKMYLLDQIGNLIVFDISDPDNPEYESTWNTPFTYSYDSCVAFHGDYAYVGKANHIFILDISGQSPVLVDTVDRTIPVRTIQPMFMVSLYETESSMQFQPLPRIMPLLQPARGSMFMILLQTAA